MRIAVIGGGPAGLAFAAFARLVEPCDEVDLWERHRVRDTYGFGVILPPPALETVRRVDATLADELAARLTTWDEITVHRDGRSLTTPVPRLGAVSRQALLEVLRQRCGHLGVRLHEGTPADLATLRGRYDLVVAADGAHSRTRTALATEFGTTVETLDPHYVWLGAQRALDGLAFLVADTPHGPAIAHAYPYQRDRSTFLVEAAHRPDPAECARLFAAPLGGARLLENRSRWNRFPQVRNARWSHGNVVLLGDAAHTAHYSIGSGTRLALDDAYALVTALRTASSTAEALVAYEALRRPVVENTQRVGRISAEWFAKLSDTGNVPLERFLPDLLTRGGRLSWGDLRADEATAPAAGAASPKAPLAVGR